VGGGEYCQSREEVKMEMEIEMEWMWVSYIFDRLLNMQFCRMASAGGRSKQQSKQQLDIKTEIQKHQTVLRLVLNSIMPYILPS
jgi:hypothetical protein